MPMLQDEFLARMEVVIKKKSSNKVTIDEVWVSEKEMRDDLKWSAHIGCTKMKRTMHIYIYSMFLFPYIHLVMGACQNFLRSRIAGAKKACEAKRETHIRTLQSSEKRCRRERVYIEYTNNWFLYIYIYWVVFLVYICMFLWVKPSPNDFRSYRKNVYDGVEEFYVITREKGSREQEESHEEIKRSSTKLEAI